MNRRPGLLSVLLSSLACSTPPAPTLDPSGPPPHPSPAIPAAPAEAPPLEPPGPQVVVEELQPTGDRTVYAVRGSKEHRHEALMLAGVYSNPLWYLNTFPEAAVRYGDFVGVQGDISCGGIATRWSSNIVTTTHRIERAFSLSGAGEIHDVTVVGYSQGAERAEWLAVHDPLRFTRFVLIASPIAPSPAHFSKAEAVVFMAGSRDVQTSMREGAVRFRAAGIPATFIVLPDARHGEMGSAPEETMSKALDWLDENARVTK